MKNVPVAIVCVALSLVLAAPLSAQKKKRKPAAPPAAVTSPLDPTLADLDRVTAATLSDLADLKAEKKHAGWRTAWMSSWRFWHHESSHNQRTQEIAESVERNLRNAMPGLVQEARASGSFAATFKLYNNLSVLCELLDSLVDSTKAEGKKADGPLANDSAAMGRIRQDIATFVEQKASALDANGNPPYPWPATSTASNGSVKKIVIDDNAPEKKPVARKTVAVKEQ
jgi:hypothetical protein